MKYFFTLNFARSHLSYQIYKKKKLSVGFSDGDDRGPSSVTHISKFSQNQTTKIHHDDMSLFDVLCLSLIPNGPRADIHNNRQTTTNSSRRCRLICARCDV